MSIGLLEVLGRFCWIVVVEEELGPSLDVSVGVEGNTEDRVAKKDLGIAYG